jgi:hypothetical protein
MKKKGERAKKRKESKKNLQLFWGIFIAILLVFGMFIVMDEPAPAEVQNFEYNNFSFYYEYDRSLGLNYVKTVIEGIEFRFFSEPYRAELFEVEYYLLEQMLYSNTTYLSLDVESQFSDVIGLAGFVLETDFLAVGKAFEKGAVSKNEFVDYPVITCLNASENTFVVTMEEGNHTGFTAEENCLRMVSEYPFGILEMRDAIMYRMLGIIE